MKFCNFAGKGQALVFANSRPVGVFKARIAKMNANMTLRRFIAGALGALIGLELCKLSNGNLVALTIFTLLGGLAGFILVAPVVFAREFKASWRAYVKKLKAESDAAIEHARKERDEHPFRLLAQKMIKKNSCLFALNFTIVFGWFLVGVLFYIGFAHYHLVFIGWAGMAILILMASSPSREYKVDNEEVAKQDFESYAEQNAELKQIRKAVLILPISVCIWTYKAVRGILRALLWCLCNLKFLGKSFVLVLAITCSAVASLNRYLAAIGAVVGCIVGYTQGKNEWLAMACGGLVGNGICFLLRLFLKILPNPNSAWPEPVKVKI